jgi:hypothetical protein
MVRTRHAGVFSQPLEVLRFESGPDECEQVGIDLILVGRA